MFNIEPDKLIMILIGVAVFVTLLPAVTVAIAEKKQEKAAKAEKKTEVKAAPKTEKDETRDAIKAVLDASGKK